MSVYVGECRDVYIFRCLLCVLVCVGVRVCVFC